MVPSVSALAAAAQAVGLVDFDFGSNHKLLRSPLVEEGALAPVSKPAEPKLSLASNRRALRRVTLDDGRVSPQEEKRWSAG
jgi:hypothetical protein